MLKQSFKTQLEFDLYKTEQEMRRNKGFLTYSERKQLKSMLEKNYKCNIIVEQLIKGKPIITNINALKVYCLPVRKDEGISHIIKDLKDTLDRVGGLGLSANQIGYNRRISFLRIPTYDSKTKKMDLKEYYIINAKIIEKSRPIKVEGEGCLSFPGIRVITKRYIFITCTYLDENFKEKTALMQDLEGLTFQHEQAHQDGKTIFDFKWKAK